MTWTYWCDVCDKPIDDDEAERRHSSSSDGDCHAECCPYCDDKMPTVTSQTYTDAYKNKLAVEWSNGATMVFPSIPHFIIVAHDPEAPIVRFVRLVDSKEDGMSFLSRAPHNHVLLVRYGPLFFSRNPATPHYYIQHQAASAVLDECRLCGRSTSPGSGLWVNRVPAFDGQVETWLCAECLSEDDDNEVTGEEGDNDGRV